MLSSFFKRSVPSPPVPVPEPVIHTITPQIKLEDILPRTPELILTPEHAILKRLKWVDWKGQVGIVHDLDSSGHAIVHYVNRETGETVSHGRVPCGELKLAGFTQIPPCRRIGMSRAYAATLGYV